MKSFSYRFNNIELRSCNENLLNKNTEHTTAEIVEWNFGKNHCWTIGYYCNSKDNYSFKFVGERPLKDSINWNELKVLIKIGYDKIEESNQDED